MHPQLPGRGEMAVLPGVDKQSDSDTQSRHQRRASMEHR